MRRTQSLLLSFQAFLLSLFCQSGLLSDAANWNSEVSVDVPLHPTLRANPFPKVTDLFRRLPLPTLHYRPEATNLGDLMRFWARPGVWISLSVGFSRAVANEHLFVQEAWRSAAIAAERSARALCRALLAAASATATSWRSERSCKPKGQVRSGWRTKLPMHTNKLPAS